MYAQRGTRVRFVVAEPVFCSSVPFLDILKGGVPFDFLKSLRVRASTLDGFPSGFKHVSIRDKAPSLA